MKSFVKLTLLVLLLQLPLRAETIIFKNGKIIYGKVTGQDHLSITVKTTEGEILNIQKTAITKVVFRDIAKEAAEKIRVEEEKKQAEADIKLAEERQLAEKNRREENKRAAELKALEVKNAAKARAELLKKEKLALQRNLLGVFIFGGQGAIRPAMVQGYENFNNFRNTVPQDNGGRNLTNELFDKNSPENIRGGGFNWQYNRFITGAEVLKSTVKHAANPYYNSSFSTTQSTNGIGVSRPEPGRLEEWKLRLGYAVYRSGRLDIVPLIGYRKYNFNYKRTGYNVSEVNVLSANITLPLYQFDPGTTGNINGKGGSAGLQVEYRWKNLVFDFTGSVWKMGGNWDNEIRSASYLATGTSYMNYSVLKPAADLKITGGELNLAVRIPVFRTLRLFVEAGRSVNVMKLENSHITFDQISTSPVTGGPNLIELKVFATLYQVINGTMHESDNRVKVGIEQTFDFKDR